MNPVRLRPIEPTAPQAVRVLAALRRGPSCLREFGQESYTARNRVGDLRKLGWTITAVPCRRHAHHGRVAEYRLVQEGGKAEVTVTREDERTSQQPGAPTPVGAPLNLFPEYSRALGHGR